MKNKKILFIVAIIILISTITTVTIINVNVNKDITLIQLSPQSKTQMMGYILKTKNNRIIAIDGGLGADKENFVKYINENGGKVDYWFITHAHNDHATVLVDVLEEKKIEVGKIYVSLNEKEWYEKNEPERSEFSKRLIDILNNNKYKVINPTINEKLNIDGIEIEILGIRNPEITQNPGNEQSMVIKFNTGKTSMLILGDTGVESSKKLLETQKDKLDADIVQMSHHGQARCNKRTL